MRLISAFLLSFIFCFPAHSARNLDLVETDSSKRVALVIGNNAYEQVGKLEKAVNDAQSVGRALQNIGYATTVLTNANRRQMNNAINAFVDDVSGGGQGVLFFAGHGVQINNQNYLLPVDIESPKREADVADQAISLQGVQDKLADAKVRLALLVIDACRDNPLPKKAGRSLGGTRGLTQANSAEGQMVVFSAGAGQQALDKLSEDDRNPNGVFTRELLPWLTKSGVSIRDAILEVRRKVHEEAKGVNHEQLPAVYDQVLGSFYFLPANTPHVASIAPPAPVAPAASAEPSNAAVELAYWQSAQQTNSIPSYEDYLRQYPSGLFSRQAQAALAKLKQDNHPAFSAPTAQSYSSSSQSVPDDEAIVRALRAGNYTYAEDISLKAPDVAENGAVVPLEVSVSRSFSKGERLYVVVNDSFIGASLTPLDMRTQPFLSTRVKMPDTGQLKAVLLDQSGQLRVASKEIKVKIGADPNRSSDSPSFGGIKMRAANTNSLEIKSLMSSSQSPDLDIKTLRYFVDGAEIAVVGLTPGSAKNPYVGIKASGAGGLVEMQVTASNGQSERTSTRP